MSVSDFTGNDPDSCCQGSGPLQQCSRPLLAFCVRHTQYFNESRNFSQGGNVRKFLTSFISKSFDFRRHCQKVSKEQVDDHSIIMFHQLVFGCFLPVSIRFALVSFSLFGRVWSFLNVLCYSSYFLAVLSPSACLSQENRKLNKAHSIAF